MLYIPEETVAELRHIDLLTYLRAYEPHELVRITAHEYTTQTHDSLRISNGKWHWFSQGIGGNNALDYLIKVKGMSFTQAAQYLLDTYTLGTSLPAPPLEPAKKKTPFVLPKADKDDNKLIQYLRERGIASSVIDYCLGNDLMYQSKVVNKGRVFYNGVFLGSDMNSNTVSAYQRGLSKTSHFKGDVAGSDKRYTFRMHCPSENKVVHVFESCIDAMSYATLLLMQEIEPQYAGVFLSVNGVHYAHNADIAKPPLALGQYLIDHPSINTISVHFDRDNAGRHAANIIMQHYREQYVVMDKPPQDGKDVNEELQNLLNQQRRPKEVTLER